MNSIDLIFLGAGYTRCVTENNAPLMDGFFDQLDEDKASELGTFLRSCVNGVEEANVEKVMSLLDQIAASSIVTDGSDVLAGLNKRTC